MKQYDHGSIGVVEQRVRGVPKKYQQEFYGAFAGGTFTARRRGMESGSVVTGQAAGQALKRGLKRKTGAMVKAGLKAGGRAANKKAKRSVGDIFGKQ